MAVSHPDPIPIDGITIVREFDAPIEAVFDAWTVGLDARPGGAWKAATFTGIGEFVTIDRPSSFVVAFTDGDPAAGHTYLTVLLDDLAGRTRMTFHQGGGELPPEALEQAKVGWQTFFDVLESLLRDAQLD